MSSYKMLAPCIHIDQTTGKEYFTSCMIEVHPDNIAFVQANKDGSVYIEFTSGKISKLGIPFWKFIKLQAHLCNIDATYTDETEQAYIDRFKHYKD